MLAEYKTKVNIGIGLGLLISIGARFIPVGPEDLGLAMVVLVVSLVGLALFLYGTFNYAIAKGQNKWLGLLGLLSLIGLIILICLPDHHKQPRS